MIWYMYANNLVGEGKVNSRDFYRYVNSQKEGSQGIPPLKSRNGSGLVESELKQADELLLVINIDAAYFVGL